MSPSFEAQYLPYLAVLAVVCGNVAGTLMLKIGAHSSGPVIFGVLSWQSLGGIGLFAAGILIYAWALRFLPLHIAQVIASLQYVGISFAAAFVLGEQISFSRWIGIGLIAVGILIAVRE